jgi:hypothetical protein
MTDFSNKRRTDRVDLAIPVEIIGADSVGLQVFRTGNAIVINQSGASIQLDYKLVPDQVVTIRNLENSKECEGRIVGLVGQAGNTFSYGVALLNSAVNLWDMAFPELPAGQNPLVRVVLTCKGCNTREIAYLDEIEMKVLETTRTIQRHCNTCRATTIRSQGGLPQESDHGLRAEVLPAGAAGLTAKEAFVSKRKHKRVPTTFSACVRQCGPPGEVVSCDDISRGGLCFRSQNRYEKGTYIEVAVPYAAKSSGNIFVPARIVHVELSGKLFRHGAVYL